MDLTPSTSPGRVYDGRTTKDFPMLQILALALSALPRPTTIKVEINFGR